jgi:hypothetical protein
LIKIFRGIYLTLFGALLGTVFGDTIWQNTLENFGLCPAKDTDCAVGVFWNLFRICVFIVTIMEIANWFISAHQKNRMLLLKKYKHDSMVASIEVFNNSDEVIENCFAKVNKVYLVIDGVCQRIIDENINDKRIRWDDGSVEVKIYKKSSDVLDIIRAYSENLELLFHSFPNLSLFVYRDMKNRENARRVKYQLEIEICGITVKDGKNVPIPPKISCWEIYYQSNGQGSTPKIDIQRILSMAEPTKGDITRSQMPNTKSFTLIVPSEK